MFCQKCGFQIEEGAAFCRNCGTRVANGGEDQQPADLVRTAHEQGERQEEQQMQTQMGNALPDKSKKKKFRKLPIIIGIAVLVVLAVIALNWEGKPDYEATVKAHAPFANSQGLPYTYGEVFDKYIPNAKWEVRESDDMAYVDITGKAKGTDVKIVITIKVSLDEKDPDLVFISPESVSVSGNESPTKDEAVRFLFAMFIAYDEGDKDLSNFSDRLDEAGL